jgi:hypothetical protein
MWTNGRTDTDERDKANRRICVTFRRERAEKLKFILCFITTPFTHREVDVFLSSARTGGEWSDLRSGRFTHGERFCYLLDRKLDEL